MEFAFLFAILMLICPPVPTSLFEHTSSFSLPFYSISLSLCLSRALSKPSSHSPIPPRPTAPISVSCHAPMSPIRKGNEARYRCKYIRPLAATLTQLPETEARMQRGREEGERRGRTRWRGTAFRQKSGPTQSMHLIGAR